VIADITMSLDNMLAVGGASHVGYYLPLMPRFVVVKGLEEEKESQSYLWLPVPILNG